MNDKVKGGAPAQLWTRNGFAGPMAVHARPSYGPDFLSATGPHVPRRALLEGLIPADRDQPAALPTVIATSRAGVRLLSSARTTRMPFVCRNVEADELHFIQQGQVKFETDVGCLVADEGDFVCIPRAIAYRYGPTGAGMRSMILESPNAVALTPPLPMGMINFSRDVKYAAVEAAQAPDGPTTLLLKSADGEITTYLMAHDPLALDMRLTSTTPVWKLNLAQIQMLSYEPHGGPPAPFLSSGNGDFLLFNLSARSGGRPPVHVNADFDEVVFYVRGPGAWGGCCEPGTVTWVPKGVLHHGPSENVPEGYQAWLLEIRATLRFTPEALAASELMETGNYFRHPSLDKA